MSRVLFRWTLRLVAYGSFFHVALQPAHAVVKVVEPLSKFYDDCQLVMGGTIASVDPATHAVVVEKLERLRAPKVKPPAAFRVFDPKGEYTSAVKPGGQAVLLMAKGAALVHVGDAWFEVTQQGTSEPPLYRIVQPAQVADRFPGRTSALIEAFREMNAKKSTLLNEVAQNVFTEPAKEVGQAAIGATWSAAGDFTGDGKAKLLVGGEGGVVAFSGGDGTPERPVDRVPPPAAIQARDVTADLGLADAKGAWGAAGDINGDGKPDAVIGGVIWTNAGGKLQRGAALDLAAAPILAAAIADATGDGKRDVAVLTRDGQWIVCENPGDPAGAWKKHPPKKLWADDARPAFAAFIAADFGDDGKPWVMVVRDDGVFRYAPHLESPAADYTRLTGADLAKHNPREPMPLDLRAAVACDANGDGRLDLLVITRTGGNLLVNRGFGTFLVDADAHRMLRPEGTRVVPFDIAAGVQHLAAADLAGDKHDDLLVIGKDGKVYGVGNPVHAAGK